MKTTLAAATLGRLQASRLFVDFVDKMRLVRGWRGGYWHVIVLEQFQFPWFLCHNSMFVFNVVDVFFCVLLKHGYNQFSICFFLPLQLFIIFCFLVCCCFSSYTFSYHVLHIFLTTNLSLIMFRSCCFFFHIYQMCFLYSIQKIQVSLLDFIASHRQCNYFLFLFLGLASMDFFPSIFAISGFHSQAELIRRLMYRLYHICILSQLYMIQIIS